AVADLAPNEIAVEEELADDQGWTLGSPVEVGFTDGEAEELTVGALYEASASVQQVVMPRATWDAHQVQTVDNLVLIGLADGVALEDGRAAVEEAAAPYSPPDVMTADEF